jgi:hypothetical protein
LTEEDKMTEATKEVAEREEAPVKSGSANSKDGENRGMGLAIRLVPAQNSDQPVVSNYSSLSTAPGMAFIDFGFLEPAVLSAIPRLAKQGGKLPETLNGRLAVRVAMGYDGLASLHQQLGRMLLELNARAARDNAAWEKKGNA